VFLGCDAAIAIRPQGTGDKVYKVVGPCKLAGLQDATALLGPLPSPWRVQVFVPASSHVVYQFYNEQTEEVTEDDPRLGPLGGQWERVHIERGNDHPLVCQFFRNQETGEIIDWDPRMDRVILEASGVKLEDILLS